MSQGKAKNRSHWDATHPGEVARDKLRKEIKAGRIIRPDQCQLCGSTSSAIIGHHWRGYAYPFDVWWICHSCNTRPDLAHDGSQTLEQMRARYGFAQPVPGAAMSGTKQDNSHLQAKLMLRKYFLLKYHSEAAPHVLDCCQGGGHIWRAIREDFLVATYLGVDVKKAKGRMNLRGGSERLLSMPGWPQNVIDIDTYGSPWKHWFAMLPNVSKPTTVFLTIGDQNSVVLKAAGTGGDYITFPPSTPEVLRGMIIKDIAPQILLNRCSQFGIILAEAKEAIADGASARYIGCHLVPGNTK